MVIILNFLKSKIFAVAKSKTIKKRVNVFENKCASVFVTDYVTASVPTDNSITASVPTYSYVT